MRHPWDVGAPANDQHSLQEFSYLLVTARSARAVEDGDIQGQLACLEAHINTESPGVLRGYRDLDGLPILVQLHYFNRLAFCI
jgi:hypothetical protein